MASVKERTGVGVLADELCVRAAGEIDEIVEDEDLAVALGACADADGGDAERGGDVGGDFARDAFENDGDGAGGFESERVAEEIVDGGDGSYPARGSPMRCTDCGVRPM